MARLKVEVLKLDKGAQVPVKKHVGGFEDFAYDLTAVSVEHAKTENGEIIPFTFVYHTGIALQVADGVDPDTAVGFSIRPRSSVWKTGMMLTNCTGTIDHGYTGEITAVFHHYNPTLPKYEVGDRIGQLFFQTSQKINFVPVNAFTNSNTGRGARGYGSTGK